MTQMNQLQKLMRTLRFVEASNHVTELIKKAEQNDASYTMFLLDIMHYEQKRREEKQVEKRLKWATFPDYKTLEEFDLKEQQSLSKKQLHQLGDLTWVDQLYNLVLLGP
uniref:ATP-binding protein n=1 Tax=Halalkalibacter hemicellulosilyticus TaxID=127886 RepID=UPI000557C358